MTRLFLDDVRNPPDDGGGPWTVCRTVDEAKAVLLAGPVEEASLDHDLGQCDACRSDVGPMHCPHVPDGRDLVAWMVAEKRWPRLKPRVHSQNGLYGPEMRATINMYWPAPLHGRATTDPQKRAVVERLLAAWTRKPALRFGQLLHCAMVNHTFDLFNAEDEQLAELVEKFSEKS